MNENPNPFETTTADPTDNTTAESTTTDSTGDNTVEPADEVGDVEVTAAVPTAEDKYNKAHAAALGVRPEGESTYTPSSDHIGVPEPTSEDAVADSGATE